MYVRLMQSDIAKVAKQGGSSCSKLTCSLLKHIQASLRVNEKASRQTVADHHMVQSLAHAQS